MAHKQSNPDWDLRNVRAFSEKGQLMRWLDVMKITDYHDQVATYQGEWLYVFDLTKPLTTTNTPIKINNIDLEDDTDE
jgi:hypothetical protein